MSTRKCLVLLVSLILIGATSGPLDACKKPKPGEAPTPTHHKKPAPTPEKKPTTMTTMTPEFMLRMLTTETKPGSMQLGMNYTGQPASDLPPFGYGNGAAPATGYNGQPSTGYAGNPAGNVGYAKLPDLGYTGNPDTSYAGNSSNTNYGSNPSMNVNYAGNPNSNTGYGSHGPTYRRSVNDPTTDLSYTRLKMTYVTTKAPTPRKVDPPARKIDPEAISTGMKAVGSASDLEGFLKAGTKGELKPPGSLTWSVPLTVAQYNLH